MVIIRWCSAYQLIDVDGYRAHDVRMWDPEDEQFVRLESVDDNIVIPSQYKFCAKFESIAKCWFVHANTTRTSVLFSDDPDLQRGDMTP